MTKISLVFGAPVLMIVVAVTAMAILAGAFGYVSGLYLRRAYSDVTRAHRRLAEYRRAQEVEVDPLTGGLVPAGWVAERAARIAAHAADPTARSGTCDECGLPIAAHPWPERASRSGPDLCAVARQHADDKEPNA